MSFERPSLTEIDRRSRADVEANMDAVPIVRRKSVLAGLVRGVAGLAHMGFGHIDWVYRQLFPDTADSAQLERHAGFRGIVRGEPDVARGSAVLTGVDDSVIPSGTDLGHDSGLDFITTAAGVIVGGTATVPIRAVAIGAAGNLPSGDRLVLLSSVPGIDSDAAVAEPGLAGGADAESDERLLQRLLLRIRQPPHGGAAHDFIDWALSVAGVTRVWVTREQTGVVTVRFVVDNAPHGPVPNDGEVDAVRAFIDERRPVAAEVIVAGPGLLVVNHQLSIEPDTPDVRTAVRAGLAELYQRDGAPGAVIPLTHIAAAISAAPGEFDHDLVAPAADIEPGVGVMPVLGNVVFV